MAAYAEGLNILHRRTSARQRAQATPRPRRCETPSYYQYDIDMPEVAEVWRRGSVVASWLLDLTAQALCERPTLEELRGPGVGLRRGPLDGRSPRSTRASRRRCSRAALYSRFASRGSTSSPTRCCRRCASSSAATPRRRWAKRRLLGLGLHAMSVTADFEHEKRRRRQGGRRHRGERDDPRSGDGLNRGVSTAGAGGAAPRRALRRRAPALPSARHATWG